MKKIALGFLCTLLALAATADELKWLESFPEAQAQSKKEGKLLLMDFTGSDWCIPCKEMETDVIKQKQFIAYANSNLVLLRVDFPLGIKQTPELEAANAGLTNQFKVEGFPTFLALNPDGQVVWTQQGYLDGGPKKFISELKKAAKKK